MYKPASLKEYLLKSIVDLKRDPEKLHVFVDEGGALGTNTPALSFRYEYTLNLIITDIGPNLDLVFVPLLAWLRIHQRDSFANPENAKKAVRFEVDMNSAASLDLSIKMPLSEQVVIKRIEPGKLDVKHSAEPQLTPAFDDDFWQMYDGGNLLAEWAVPKQP